MDTKELQAKLRQLATELISVSRSLGDSPPKAKKAKGTCLFCSEPILVDEKATRGCHDRCRKKIKEDGWSDAIAIERGWLLPAQSGGRKKTRPPEVTEQLKKLGDVRGKSN